MLKISESIQSLQSHNIVKQDMRDRNDSSKCNKKLLVFLTAFHVTKEQRPMKFFFFHKINKYGLNKRQVHSGELNSKSRQSTEIIVKKSL